LGNVNVRLAQGIPGQPAVAAAAEIGGKIGLADEGRRGDSAANNFRLRM
jgi:hypothetical protein